MHKFAWVGVSWLVASVLLFLSVWIVLSPPNFFWLQLAVGAPEVSPLLLLMSAIALIATLFFSRWRHAWSPRLLLAVLTTALVLSSLPLLQQPKAVVAADRSMAIAFGPSLKTATTPTFSWLTSVRGFQIADVRQSERIPFAKPDGSSLALKLYQPPAAGPHSAPHPAPHPALVILYGGGWTRGDASENEAFGRFFAARGYVVVAIEYRLAPEYRYPAQVEDVSAALAFIRDRAADYEIDPARLSLVGWSAGAHLAMLEGFQSTEGIQSIVNFYGPVDLAAGYANPPVPDPLQVQQVLKAFFDGTPAELPDAYAEASPITYVKAATPGSLPPVLLVYGGRDHIVESKYGQSLYEALLKSGNTAVWVHIPWAEHAFDKIFNGVSNQLALHFVERFLAHTL
ncbi:MAG: alpha/beta hydrolase [Cyanobacteria bacterium J06598_1]